MTMIITITNQKGGIGKSTTAHNIGAGLALKGKKTLLIDLDPQGNLSMSCGISEPAMTVYSILTGKAPAKQVIKPVKKNLDIIPASLNLSTADLELTDVGKEYKLAEAIEPVRGDYDYIVIDTPPALGILSVNALTIAHRVIIPAQADVFSLEAIRQLYSTIEAIQRYTNKELRIGGILLTRYNNRNILTQNLTEVLQKTAKQLDTKVFKSTIRETVAIREAQAKKQDIFAYAKSSGIANDYMGLVMEIMKDKLNTKQITRKK